MDRRQHHAAGDVEASLDGERPTSKVEVRVTVALPPSRQDDRFIDVRGLPVEAPRQKQAGRAENRLHRELPQGQYGNRRADRGEFTEETWRAAFGGALLFLVRVASAEGHVGDPGSVAIELRFLKKTIQELAGRADERLAGRFFNSARSFAHYDELRMFNSGCRHNEGRQLLLAQ